MSEVHHCCCDCKYSAVGFRETYVCTHPDKQDKEPMYDAFDTCEQWEQKLSRKLIEVLREVRGEK
jgi:hypothetical protein